MKKYHIIIRSTILILLPFLSVSQPRNGLFIGVGNFHEINAGFETGHSPWTFSMEMAYVIPFKNEAYYDPVATLNFFTVLARGLNTEGFRFRAGLSYYFDKKWIQAITVKPEYGKLASGKFIIDEGKSGGSSGYPYAEFTETYQTYGLHVIYGMHFCPGLFSFYAGPGLRYKDVERKYTVEGTYGYQIPSDKTEHHDIIEFALNFGLRIYITGYEKNKAE